MTQGFRREVQDLLARIEREDLVSRIWARDHRVWRESPDGIADRLGWLDLPRSMLGRRQLLGELAADARREGVERVVLLGMGGSSLAPEVFGRTFAPAQGSPGLTVLDSTVPDAVRSVRAQIDPAATLFIVSSKSGTTIEPLTLMAYFWEEAAAVLGDEVPSRFAAITDPGTPLAELARSQGLRWVVENPPDIGGRYAALSLVGLVPAALLGVDTATLLRSAGLMAEACGTAVPCSENPAAVLAATIAAGAAAGRDKLTIWVPEPIAGFGLWLEQLVAESLGKEGRGVVPVVGEPLLEPSAYGEDRLFVMLMLEGDDAGPMSEAFERVADAGHPTVRLELADAYDLGAQFMLWELTTALVGAVMGVDPFDQPDVEAAKAGAKKALEDLAVKGTRPDAGPRGTLERLLAEVRPGDYVAVMAYVPETGPVEEALAALRRRISERHGVATTCGYGPRFLHSTGQMHKGGPESVVGLQIVDTSADLPVPGRPYGLRALVDAQACGDFEALTARRRRVAREVVNGDVATGIRALAERV